MAYQRFIKWRQDNNMETFSEDVLLTYFVNEMKDFKCSSIAVVFSTLRATLLAKHGIDISIYLKLRAFLKSKAKGYVAKTTKILTTADILKFIHRAPDIVYLLTKVVLIIGITGACRRDELCFLKVDQVEDIGTSILIKLPDSKTKALRQFAITGHFYSTCKKYLLLRPPDMKEDRFFLNYQKGKCTRQVVGKNKIGNMGKEVAKYLNLPNPEKYTGHCFRKSAISLGDVRNNIELMMIGHGQMTNEFKQFQSHVLANVLK